MRTIQTQRAQVTQRGAAPRWPSPSSCGSPPPPLWAPPPIHPRSGGGDPDLQSPPCLRGSENGGPSPAPSPLPPEERRWRRKGGGGQAREFTVAASGSDGGGGCAPHPRETQGWRLCVSRVGAPPNPAPSLGPLPKRLGLPAPPHSGGPAPTASPLSPFVSPGPHSMYSSAGAPLLYWATIRCRPSRPRRLEVQFQLSSAPARPPEPQPLCLQLAVNEATCIPIRPPTCGAMVCSEPQFIHLKNVDRWPSLQCWWEGITEKRGEWVSHLGSMGASGHSFIHSSIHYFTKPSVTSSTRSLIYLFALIH